MKIKAAVLHEPNSKFSIEEVDLAEPKHGEVRIKVVATGVCQTDEGGRAGRYAAQFPMVLGHEGAGIIEELGPGVCGFDIGDHVVVSYPYCNICPSCRQGRPTQCYQANMLWFGGKMPDGTSRLTQNGVELDTIFNQGTFATHAVVNANSLVKVDKELDLRLFGPMGCGIQTGAGTVLNVLRPMPGTSIVIFGTGSVGLAGLMAAKVADCYPIVAVDIKDSRLESAREMGATHTVNSFGKDETALVAEIKQVVGKFGADYVFDTSGVPDCLRAGMLLMHRGSVGANVGCSKEVVLNPWSKYMGGGKTWHAVAEGNSVASVFIPQLISLYQRGQFPVDKIVTFFPFDKINEAFDANHDGSAIKPILVISED